MWSLGEYERGHNHGYRDGITDGFLIGVCAVGIVVFIVGSLFA